MFEKQVTISQSEIMLKRLQSCNAEKKRLRFPLRMEAGEPLIIELSSLVSDIGGLVNSIDNILAIIAFGSAVRVKYVTKGKKWWLFDSRQQVMVPFDDKPPRDLDLFVLVKDGEAKNIAFDLHFSYEACDGYGTWTEHRMISKGYDLFIMDQATFDEQLEQKNTCALSIIQDGVLLLGSFPHVLNGKSKILWDSSERAMFSYQP